MSAITTHILDISTGLPAAGVSVVLERMDPTVGWKKIGDGLTDSDGRMPDILSENVQIIAGDYRIIFETGAYFEARAIECFYPNVTIAFTVRDAVQHYHVPLLLSPFGYSTYRGS